MIISGSGPPANLNIAIINTTSMYITWSPPSQSNGVITQYLVGCFDKITVVTLPDTQTEAICAAL
jgi:hypothetical protein